MTQQLATLADFATYGLPPVATASVSDAMVQAELDAASDDVMAALSSQIDTSLGLDSWGLDITRPVCIMAAWRLLSGPRGLGQGDTGAEALRQAYAAIAGDPTVAGSMESCWLRRVATGAQATSAKPTRIAQGRPQAYIYSRPGAGW